MNDIINYHKTEGEWKTHLTRAYNFFCSKDFKELHTMHRKSDNVKIMMSNETDEIIEELFDSLLQKYQKKG